MWPCPVFLVVFLDVPWGIYESGKEKAYFVQETFLYIIFDDLMMMTFKATYGNLGTDLLKSRNHQ